MSSEFDSLKMTLAIVITVVMILELGSAQTFEFHKPGLPERCLPGSSFHKDSPTVEDEREGGLTCALPGKAKRLVVPARLEQSLVDELECTTTAPTNVDICQKNASNTFK